MQLPGSRSLSLLAALALAGCLGNSTPAGRVQEAAQDLNTAARFGRMDIAMDRVGKELREEFAKHHAAWGGQVRVMEAEFAGLNMKDKENAVLYVQVTWQKLTESDLRTTTLVQTWKDERGTWRLQKEERTSGDYGLLGESTPPSAAKQMAPQNAQFQTVYIR